MSAVIVAVYTLFMIISLHASICQYTAECVLGSACKSAVAQQT